MSEARTTRVTLVVSGGLWALLFGPFLVGGGLPVYRDLLLTYLPVRHFWAERVRAGHLPGWFPYEGLGESFRGQGITSTFHPANLLFLFFSEATALRIELAGTVLVGIIGQALLARRFRLAAPAAVAGAMALALSGYTLSMMSNLVYLRGLCMLPWVALFAAMVCEDRGRTRAGRPWGPTAGLAVSWGLIPLGGDAAATFLAALVVLAMVVASGAWRRIGWVLGGAVLAGVLAAPELLPASALRSESIVAGFRNVEFLSTYWALHPARLPELLLPGVTSLADGWSQASTLGEAGRWAESVFLGAATLCFALAVPRQRVPLAFLALGALGLWLALGVHGGLEPLLRLLPAFNSIRYPEKHLALAVFGFATAAAFGVDRLTKTPRALVLPLALGAGSVMLLFFVAGTSELAPLLRALGTLGALALVLVALPRSVHAAWLAPLVLVATSWNPPLGMLTVPAEEFAVPRTPLPGMGGVWVERDAHTLPTDEATMQAWASEAHGALAGNLSALQHRAAFGLVATLPLAPKRERQLFGWTLSDTRGLAPLFGYDAFLLADGRWLSAPATPRAWLATPRGVTTERELISQLRQDPTGARAHPLLLGAFPPPAEGPIGEVTWVRDEIDEFELEARLIQPGALFLVDQHAPGWKAHVDGQPAEIVIANALSRAVLLSTGVHRVRFSYETPRSRLGMALGLAGLLALLGLAVAAVRSRSQG